MKYLSYARFFVYASLPCILGSSFALGSPVKEKGRLVQDEIPMSHYHFDGVVGERVKANIDNWLTVLPETDPGLLEMFATRDAGPQPDWDDWAGEYVGKYLISGVQAMRMSDDAKLKETLQRVVNRLVVLQAEDGYLGPWQKQERLRGHWDAWGHYHVMLGLMMWYDQTGDEQAFQAARRIADLVCNTFLDSGFRVYDAGTQTTNMSIIHGMTLIYRKTGEPRYLRMAKEVLEDFKRAGDYYRTGLDGTEFFRTSRVRWESLHSIQGLAELYRITGDESFRQAFLHQWASMRRFDQRNTGGFSAGEAVKGTPYLDEAIETCCVIAWQTVMLDALKLTGDPTIADDIELTTFNAVFGSQHPSGAWCTYDTPMNGARQASHVYAPGQTRKTTPHIICCSVNGPRGYGILSEWAVMRRDNGLVLNFYSPMRADVSLTDGTPVTILQRTNYPLSEKVELRIVLDHPKQFPLWVRIPVWATGARVTLNGQSLSNVTPGEYFVLDRTWQEKDQLTLELNMNLRYEAGDLEQAGKVSIYRGPILLASDNRFRQGNVLPNIDVSKLADATHAPTDEVRKVAGKFQPWIAIDVPTVEGQSLRLIDFASAGPGTLEGSAYYSYFTWLPAVGIRPPPPVAWKPADGSTVGPGPIQFVWRSSSATSNSQHAVVVSDSPSFDHVVLRVGGQQGHGVAVPADAATKLTPHKQYYWKLIAYNEFGECESIAPFKRFTIDPSAESQTNIGAYGERREDQMVVAVPLQGDIDPEYGVLLEAKGWKPVEGPDGSPNTAVELNGQDGTLKYGISAFPEENYCVSLCVSLTKLPKNQPAILFSAWKYGADPLRLVVTDDKFSAHINNLYSTEGISLETGKWYHIIANKQRETLRIYVDGQMRTMENVPEVVISGATEFAIGSMPDHMGNSEYPEMKVSDFCLYARALSDQEIESMSNSSIHSQ